MSFYLNLNLIYWMNIESQGEVFINQCCYKEFAIVKLNYTTIVYCLKLDFEYTHAY